MLNKLHLSFNHFFTIKGSGFRAQFVRGFYLSPELNRTISVCRVKIIYGDKEYYKNNHFRAHRDQRVLLVILFKSEHVVFTLFC